MNKFGYPVIGMVETSNGAELSLLDIPMMSDERWQELAVENAVHNYTKKFGHAPESAEQAVCWQRAWIRSILEEYGDLPEQKAREAS
ncbi:MAG: hypothetical protein Q4E91_06035 [Lachnospiraceae bacterium]|nr:hypothetical protein [Lachnospiraceae bacterium]